MNEALPKIVLTGLAVAQDQDEFTGQEEDVRNQEEDEKNVIIRIKKKNSRK
jgi:hypothetical protein